MADDILSQDRLKEILHYDPSTGVFTNITARKKIRVGEVAGFLDKSSGYVYIMVDRKNYRAHRLAWFYVHGTFPPDQLDHINRVRTDNRLCNLRLATHAENGQNQSLSIRNTSGHVGVSWFKASQKWMAHIKIQQKPIYLGIFTDLQEAISARKAAEQKYHTFQHGLP